MCEVNLTLHIVYLIAAVPEMRDEEEGPTALSGSDPDVSDPNMQRAKCPDPFRSLLGHENI